VTATTSILDSIKKVLNLPADNPDFDQDILLHINSVFSTLAQLGIGPTAGFSIEDNTTTWDAFLGTDNRLNSVKSYMYLKIRLMFDPPVNPHTFAAVEKNAQEFEWRLNITHEGDTWVPPTPPPPLPEPIFWDTW
jgi:hypothetical protein